MEMKASCCGQMKHRMILEGGAKAVITERLLPTTKVSTQKFASFSNRSMAPGGLIQTPNHQ